MGVNPPEHPGFGHRSNLLEPPDPPGAAAPGVEAALDRSVHQVPIGILRPADSPRIGENLQHARTLGACGAVLPPILVHRETMRVIDGMHRLRAALMQQRDLVEVTYFDGSTEDAFVLAVESNIAHGMPLTLAERAAAAARIIITHAQWSDRAIAAVAGLDPKTVAALRRRGMPPEAAPQVRVGQDGKFRPVDPVAGRRAASRLISAEPQASLRHIARRAGISPGTVRDVRARLERGEDPLPPALRTPEPAAPAASAAPEPAPGPAGPVPGGRERSAPHVPVRPQPAVRTAGSGPGLERVFTSLCKDPSLRQSETGRLLLRLLEMHLPAQFRRITACVPSYRAGMVAAAAAECARAWQHVADTIEHGHPQ
ncbi:ParB/RepB/Spo0J family partition protein [Streptomyces sp. AN091965]|uniref:ParB/RepB/Spo0J family partition protein n=1 Tax=Streptomyces sp. AN091965 TaxID=2927803 RepID=UPI001F620FD4|nr:ParB/RepB/Spo0J family partition protein [Streptomyces sp. AN091965]MCI3927777.1 ParB/RepB/Spo0J family partition protein [Streptomyces sp. AN091965]